MIRKGLRRSLLVLLLLAAAGGAWFASAVRTEYWRRAQLYGYDVRANTPLSFGPDAQRSTVEVAADSLRWPLARGACHSAFLRLSVAADLVGRWVEPALEVAATGGEHFRQHFERGARGERWLNVSPLCFAADADDTIPLVGHQLAWGAQRAELVAFPPPVLGPGPLLVLAPHPDDAEIAAFGLYRSRESYIVTVTAGDYPGRGLEHLAPDAASREALRGRLRVWDTFAVPLWGGVPTERVVNLGYGNGLLEAMRARPTEVAGASRGGSETVRRYRRQVPSLLLPDRQAEGTWTSLVADLVELLGRIRPSTIVAPHPVLDVSTEHRVSTAALLEALAVAGEPEALLLLYTNHAGTEFFPYGPADGLVTLPRPARPFALDAALSFPLSPDAVRDKLLALDAMHDLRSAPHPLLGEATLRELRTVRRLAREWWRDPHDYYSYLRRAARPNEVFFPIDGQRRTALREQVQRIGLEAPDTAY